MSEKRIKPNPTDAKTLALYFLELVGAKLTKSNISRTIVQVKNVLADGYTVDEINKTIDHVLARKADVYSFGYIAASIEDTVRELRKLEEENELKRLAAIAREEMAASNKQHRGRVDEADESSERNRRKAREFGVQSRFGKKYDFDMFEG